MNGIQNLHDKYFRGETTHEEEKLLRSHFLEGKPADELAETAPLFSYFAEEESIAGFLRGLREEKAVINTPKFRPIRLLKIGSVAATLLLGLFLLTRSIGGDSTLIENSVWINGEKITHLSVVQAYAETSFEKVVSDENTLEEQLSFMLE